MSSCAGFAVGLREMSFSFEIHPEVISIHIPKTAGSSFHAILKNHYGWRLKHIQHQEDIKTWSAGQYYRADKPYVKAIHGHIRPHKNWKDYYPNAKWVCWLRNPSDRVISAYHHLKRTQELGDRNQRLFKQIQPSLETFISHPEFENVTQIYQRFLGNFNPDDFAFIGRTEYFEEDLQQFARLIGVKNLKPERVNVGQQKVQHLPEVMPDLQRILAREHEIYNTFLKAFYP